MTTATTKTSRHPLIGIDADSWRRVAEWLLRAGPGAILLDPLGRRVAVPDSATLRAWAEDAALAGADDAAADFEAAAER